jgi:predicted transcriptional regulator
MQKENADRARIILNLLESVGQDGQQSQRRRALEFGLALGLVNSYLKYCVRKGFIKVKHIPAQRYVYFLTPKGFAEKSRLTVLLLSNSLAFFRQARRDCAEVLGQAKARGWTAIALLGDGELAEISALCALEAGIVITAVIDRYNAGQRFLGLPVVAAIENAGTIDGIVVTDRFHPQESFERAIAILGTERVIAPSLLGIGPSPAEAA